MSKRSKYRFIVCCCFFVLLTACDSTRGKIGQHTPSSADMGGSIAPWKNNARGAYSIIFDDYCFDAAHGIQDYAAAAANLRDLRFGFAVVVGECNDTEWRRAREMVAHGHEVINHSWSHRCGLLQPPWCVDVWDEDDFALEIGRSTRVIEANTGVKPQFFAFPYDLHTPAMIRRLRQLGYLGARGGLKGALVAADFDDSFALNFDVRFDPENENSQQVYSLNDYVDAAIAEGKLAFREVHGVGDHSWSSMPLSELEQHFDYLQRKADSFQIWVAPISEIIRYRDARRQCMLRVDLQQDGKTIRLAGDRCDSTMTLSVLLAAIGGELRDPTGQIMPQINGVYNLQGNTEYRLWPPATGKHIDP